MRAPECHSPVLEGCAAAQADWLVMGQHLRLFSIVAVAAVVAAMMTLLSEPLTGLQELQDPQQRL